MILKPSSLSPSIPMDASQQITISWKNLGDRQYYYSLAIYNNSTNALVYNVVKTSSLYTFHVVPSNSLVNGNTYKYQVTVYGSDGVSNATSEWILLKCSSTPTASFTNLSATIGNNSYTLQGTYGQSQSIPIKTWQILLYNSYSEIIGNSGLVYNSNIEYEIAGLDNGNSYFAELQVRSQDNLLFSTNKIAFSVVYDVPKSALVLTATVENSTASVNLGWHVSQILGSSNSSTYIDSEKLDVTNGKSVWFDEGFTISNNFTTELWVESITNYNFNINTNASLIAKSTYISDTTAIWLENSSQSTELPMTFAKGNQTPVSANILWIEDINQPITTTFSKTVVDVYAPSDTSALWLDLSGGTSANMDILKLQNSSGDFISIRYFNNKFHLYKNDDLISSVAVSGSKYYLYVQQIGDTLNLYAEVIS